MKYTSQRTATPLCEQDRIGYAGAKLAIAELSSSDVIPTRQCWLRPEGAAAYTGIDAVTLATWRVQKVGPNYRKVGARVVYHVDDLDDWMRSHRMIEGSAP